MAGKNKEHLTHGYEGREFGRWRVLEFLEQKSGYTFWLCECSCSMKTRRAVRLELLLKGLTNGCGCKNREITIARQTKHGKCKSQPCGGPSREYAIWNSMIQRCHNPNNHAYSFYGATGVTVFPAWRESFAAWYAYMGDRPSSKHSIDRWPNKAGSYEPGNVRWAVCKEQSRNRKDNRFYELNGETRTLAEWAEISGFRYFTVHQRLHKLGWSLADAITKPVGKNGRRKKVSEVL